MAEAVGLALGAISIGSLFTTCIECFDIVIGAKTFSITYELLCAQLELEHLRFLTWGQSVGLISAPNAPRKQQRNAGLDQPHVQPVIRKHLLCIKHLLEEAAKLNARYATADEGGNAIAEVGTKLRLFEHTYNRFKRRVQENQKRSSPWKVTRWTLHDQQNFESTVQKLRNFVDGLEKVTISLDGVYKAQQRILREEVNHIADVESLNMVYAASSSSDRVSPSASHRLLSDAASERLGSIGSESQPASSNVTTYYTAPTKILQGLDLEDSEFHLINTDNEPLNDAAHVPQNQRLLLAHQSKGKGRMQYSPVLPSLLEISGKALASSQQEDLVEIDVTLAVKKIAPQQADRLLCRILLEFKRDPIPFISIAPIDLNIRDLLTSVEGPPGSPYEGGVFFIRMAIPPDFPFKPPTCRFITKTYHPNVDPRGNICLEVLSSRWDPRHGRLEKLLLAICALLDDPCVDDPLVPEIAETYVRDRAAYDENARFYTKSYACGPRPKDLEDIRSLERLQEQPDPLLNRSSTFASRYLVAMPHFNAPPHEDGLGDIEVFRNTICNLSQVIAKEVLDCQIPARLEDILLLGRTRQQRQWAELLFALEKFHLLTGSTKMTPTQWDFNRDECNFWKELCHQCLDKELAGGSWEILESWSGLGSRSLTKWYLKRIPQEIFQDAWGWIELDSGDCEQELQSCKCALLSSGGYYYAFLGKETIEAIFWTAVEFCKEVSKAEESARNKWKHLMMDYRAREYMAYMDDFIYEQLHDIRPMMRFRLPHLTLFAWDLIAMIEYTMDPVNDINAAHTSSQVPMTEE